MSMKLSYRPVLNPTAIHTIPLRSYDADKRGDLCVSLGGTMYNVSSTGVVRSAAGVIGTRAYTQRAA